MGYNKDLMTPLLLYSTNYTTCHTLTHCTNTSLPHKSLQKLCNISESSNDEQMITGQSRWNPTREQMMELEEVYRSGTRTPTTQQIQEIASKLQKYGRCEGKNVFYWFQNHKSRERLKRRRPDQQEGLASSNVPEEEPLRKDNLVGSENQDSSVLRRRGSLLSSSPTHPQNNNNDYGKMERGLVEEKEATWQNKLNPINTSDNCDYQMVITSKRSQEAEHYSMNEEEEARKSRTLDLFPVIESQEKTDATGFEEKNTKPNQFCTNYFYYYEFMPLMN